MAFCRDKSVSMLNRFGYNVVKYPKPSISPLDMVIQYSKKYESVTSLPKIWDSSIEIPIINSEPVPKLNIIESDQLSGSVGIAALMDIFSANLNLSALKDKSIKLIIDKPQRIFCDINDIANFIRQGNLKSGDAFADHFQNKDRRVYVITEVIASSHLRIVISGKTSAEANIAAKDITEKISASVVASSTSSKDNEIQFNNEDHLVTFGFKQAEIYYDGKWILELPEKPGKATLGKTDSISNNILEKNALIEF